MKIICFLLCLMLYAKEPTTIENKCYNKVKMPSFTKPEDYIIEKLWCDIGTRVKDPQYYYVYQVIQRKGDTIGVILSPLERMLDGCTDGNSPRGSFLYRSIGLLYNKKFEFMVQYTLQ
ncbi:MAG: hypothetical protein JNL74_18765 [Fibrobacteres bacterium]|nr:hypothetical protein [Fibrobacterota bacterium]